MRFDGVSGKLIKNNTSVRLTDNGTFYPVADNGSAIKFTSANGTRTIVSMDTVNNRINGDTPFQLGIGLSTGSVSN